MDILITLSSIGAFLGGTAAWAAYLSPRARALRNAKIDAVRRQMQFHADWEGQAARPGVKGTPGVMERLAKIEAKLEAPILNGKGEDALAKIAAVDTRTNHLLRRVLVVEKILKIGQP